MTERLFYKDSYIKECIANVLEIIEKDGKFTVVLDRTVFYPEGGGQPSDTGYIDDAKVLDVYEEGDKIYHVIDRPLKNREVHCLVDLERRIDYMQQHSGEHILASCFYKLLNTRTSSFHMGDEYSTVDISLPEVSEELVAKVENMANEAIYNNYTVRAVIVTEEESKKMNLRRYVDGEKEVRIVEIENVDACACCGTHVKRTGEVGIIKIIKTEKYKGLTRIYFKCGKRAFKDYSKKHDIVTTLVRNFSTGEGEILNKINSDIEHMKELSRKLSEYRKKLCRYEAEDLKGISKNNIICHIYEDKEMDELQKIVEELSDSDNFIVLASAKLKQILVCSGGGYSLNLGQFFKENIKEFGGRGGGKSDRAQGSFENLEGLKKFRDALLNKLHN
ncbi:MAG: alanyl-tRNA editing protein [Clostridiales bacterium]|uniref:alanyl-tRNA editing protein n=1 Tax=Clostridium sp. N3C TaxID=1776758 RepID=UPI00092DFD3B|nr:DHHA1 domain-containing protein [Clostridium sp. N3C]NLZ48849.1 alanyl-tRNA editing protein [Clostridiales bacterium]SCN25218.1 Alanine-tRNA ligase [Clostridium sp. N3C]